jgi:hypothetical protein
MTCLTVVNGSLHNYTVLNESYYKKHSNFDYKEIVPSFLIGNWSSRSFVPQYIPGQPGENQCYCDLWKEKYLPIQLVEAILFVLHQ